MGTGHTADLEDRGISQASLAKLRGILVSSLSRENLPADIERSSLDSPPQAPARRRRKVRFSESKSVDCLETAGAVPENQRNNSRPSSATKQGEYQNSPSSSWYAENAVSQVYDGTLPLNQDKESAASQRDREERLRALKERHNEERQKKLDELKQQALAAQKFREQKEEERRRRMEELRLRDTDRRHQVEERKRQIWEAERERREAILRKNQEREARIETKRKNERSSIVFAFGSSTPRMLEPADAGGSYWATGRATSTSNMMMLSMSAAPGPLTRRSSERELDGSKKRATSAGGINRSKQPGGLRSGEVTPSRPQSSMSQHSMCSGTSMVMSSSVHAAFKPRAAPRRPRPYSIAVTGVSADSSAATTPTRHSLSAEHRNSKAPATAPDKDKPPLPKAQASKKPATPKPEAPKKFIDKIKSTKSSASPTPKATPLQSPGAEPEGTATNSVPVVASKITENGTSVNVESQKQVDGTIAETQPEPAVVVTASAEEVPAQQEVPVQQKEQDSVEVGLVQPEVQPTPTNVSSQVTSTLLEPASDLAESDMTASMIAKRITTEEEAKAALAERRRLAREQAEREAELERQRLEAERLAEEQRIREEEEEQKRMEEEQLRLAEEARQAEQERLRKAIEEAQKREEEEKKQREEEAKQKIEREEAEKKAREEAERQRQEMEIRLKKEEEDRIERRKRVEDIMRRTRGLTKGSTPTNTPTKEDGDGSISEEGQTEPRRMTDQEQFLRSERTHSAANNLSLPTTPVKQNGHQNGMDNVVEQNNVTNNLLDLSIEGMGVNPLPQPEILPPTTLPTNGKIVNEDNVNFNTAPPTNPFIAFQDNKKQETVNDLLS